MFTPIGTHEDTPRHRWPIVTILIILANLAVFWHQFTLLGEGGEPALAAFFNQYGVIPVRPSLQAIFASMFIHGGIVHFISNMLFLAPFGDNVEDRLGHLRYLIFYLGGGVIASLAHIWTNPTSTIPSVGASGAIAAVLAGYLVYHPRGRVRSLVFLGPFITSATLPALLFIGMWFLLQVASGVADLGAATAQTGGVAYWAHIGGFVAGLVLAVALAIGRPRPGDQGDYEE